MSTYRVADVSRHHLAVLGVEHLKVHPGGGVLAARHGDGDHAALLFGVCVKSAPVRGIDADRLVHGPAPSVLVAAGGAVVPGATALGEPQAVPVLDVGVGAPG